MLIIQVIALLAVSGLYGHSAARAWDTLRVSPAPRRRYAALKPARRA